MSKVNKSNRSSCFELFALATLFVIRPRASQQATAASNRPEAHQFKTPFDGDAVLYLKAQR